MALIKCTECGMQISDRAEQCIHCGCPMSEIKKDIEREKLIQIEKMRREQEEKKTREYERQERIKLTEQLVAERKKMEAEYHLEYKKAYQERIGWNNVLCPLTVTLPNKNRKYKISYFESLKKDKEAHTFFENNYYVIPEIHRYIQENKIPTNQWDFIFDAFSKNKYDFKMGISFLQKAAEMSYFSFKQFSENDCTITFINNRNILKFVFKLGYPIHFLLNGIRINASKEKTENLLKVLSLENYHRYLRISDERDKRIREENAKKLRPSNKPWF